jgi:group I intron endonuclease
MDKKINYVYLTKNKINGKQYIGDHSTNNLDDRKTKSYLGSGLLILEAIKKYGRENFQKEILEFFPTKQEAFDAQEKYIRLHRTHVSQEGYNISWRGGHQVKNGISAETLSKMSQSLKGMKAWNKGLKMSDDFCEKMRQKAKGNTYHLGKTHSEKTKKIIGQKHIGNTYRLGKKATEEERKVLSDSHKGQIPWNKGKKGITEETKDKMRNAKLGKNPFENMPTGICKYCGAEMKMSHLNRFHNDNCKLKK